MSGRMRSPKYPSISLDQSIDLIKQIHEIERTNPIDRDVAAKALGYTGISGRSATILASLVQYGLLGKTGKNEIRVTNRAVEILYPDSTLTKDKALKDAATEPELFQKVTERFTDGMPSENALKSFLIKEGFTNAAISPAISAYKETFSFLKNAIESESYSFDDQSNVESQLNPTVESNNNMIQETQTLSKAHNPNSAPVSSGNTAIENGPDIRFVNKNIYLGGVITSESEAEEIIATITALKPMLKQVLTDADKMTNDNFDQNDE